MRVWHYHPETRRYHGTSSMADPSPLEPGVFLIPANATEVEPPFVPDGKQAIFDGDNWTLDFVPQEPKPPLKERLKLIPKTLFAGPTMREVFGGTP